MHARAPRSTGRRVGRDQILDAAVGMMAGADLADLLSFLGTRAVAEAADVRPATVHHHFATKESTKRNAKLAAAVLESCFGRNITKQGAEPLAEVAGTGEPGAGEVDGLVAAAADNLRARTTDTACATATFLAAAAARSDPLARDALRAQYDGVRSSYAPALELLAAALGRRFDTENGWDADQTALFGNALSTGLLLHHQFAPDAVDVDRYGELCLRLFEAVTVPDDEPLTDPVTDRLLQRVRTLELPEASGLDQGKRARVIDAVRTRHARGGAAALTVSAVAREAGVSRGTVLANFGDRAGLAAPVWAQYLPEIELRLSADRERGMPLARVLERHFVRVVERCQQDRELTAMFLEGVLRYTIREGARTHDDPADPRVAVPLAALLVPVLLDAAADLSPGFADTAEAALELAATLTNVVMVRTMSRPEEPAAASVELVLDLLLEGMLRRPPAP